MGKATIKGKVRAYRDFPFRTDNDQVSVTSYDPVQKTYVAKIKPDGTFVLTFPKGFIGEIQFNFIDNNPRQVLAGPGDLQYYLIEPTVTTTVIKFSGSHARVNREMGQFIKARAENWPKTGDNSPRLNRYYYKSLNVMKLTYEDILARESQFLEDYISKHEVSDLFKQWAKADTQYEYAYRLCENRRNQHHPVTDPEFFKQYAINDAGNLISSNYLKYISSLPSSKKSPKFNSIIVFPQDEIDRRAAYRTRLDSAGQQIFDDLLKYADWSDAEFKADFELIKESPEALMKFIKEKPGALEKYLIPKDSRFAISYITSQTTGMVRDYLFAGYILHTLNNKSEPVHTDSLSDKLFNAYIKVVPKGTYTELIKNYFMDKS